MSAYHRRTYLVPPEHEDAFTAELWSHGILGCEIREEEGRLRVDVYLPDPLPRELASWSLEEWRSRGVEAGEEEAFAERDWLAEYRASARPFEVGRRFLVDPRDGAAGIPAPEERILLSIPARTAFGTGSHESTRLAVEWLEDLDLAGLDVVDVGTGSGILVFAALVLGARRAVGFDVDPSAVLVARQNAGLNRLYPRFFAGRLAALGGGASFDLALVNVLPERILDELPRLFALLRPGAGIVSSGNLWSRREELAERFASWGWEVAGEKRDGEWAAFLLRRPLRSLR